MALLMTRGTDEINDIASQWSIALPEAHKAENAAYLGREVLRDCSAHRFWETMDSSTRDIAFAFAATPEMELSRTGLERSSAELRSLQRAGVVWAFEESERAGGIPSLTLPPVRNPTLLMPPEIQRLFQRLDRDLRDTDADEQKLEQLISKMGTGELENVLAYWGVATEPGSFTRNELIEIILNKASITRTADVFGELPESARTLYTALLDKGGSYPTLRLAEEAELSRTELREATNFLSESLLALEVFKGEWHLFAPHGLQHSLSKATGISPILQQVAPVENRPHPVLWPAAWDLTNLLRALQLYDIPAKNDTDLPDEFVSGFGPSLVTHPTDPAASLNLLLAAARKLGAVEVRHGKFRTTSKLQQWTSLDLYQQSRRILGYWGENGYAGEVDGLDRTKGFRPERQMMRAARRSLLEIVSRCEPGAWYSLTSLIASVRSEQPHILRPQNKLVRELGTDTARTALDNWDSVEGEWIKRVLHGPLLWTGVIALTDSDEAEAFQLTRCGAALTGIDSRLTRPPGKGVIRMGEQGRLRVLVPSSELLWELAGFARPLRANGQPVYTVDRRSIARARKLGITPPSILATLRQYSENGAVATNLAEKIKEWGRAPNRIRALPAIVVECETENGANELMSSAVARPHSPVRVAPTQVLLSLPPGGDVSKEFEGLVRRLTRSGLFAIQ